MTKLIGGLKMSKFNKWDTRFVLMAEHVAGWSKDRSTQVGAVIVDDRNRILSTGYNGFPSGADDEEISRHERPAKYMFTEHAERNAIYTAANLGISLSGKKIYVSGELFCCIDCARAIIQTGIKQVFAARPSLEKYPHWYESNQTAYDLLIECGVEVIFTN